MDHNYSAITSLIEEIFERNYEEIFEENEGFPAYFSAEFPKISHSSTRGLNSIFFFSKKLDIVLSELNSNFYHKIRTQGDIESRIIIFLVNIFPKKNTPFLSQEKHPLSFLTSVIGSVKRRISSLPLSDRKTYHMFFLFSKIFERYIMIDSQDW